MKIVRHIPCWKAREIEGNPCPYHDKDMGGCSGFPHLCNEIVEIEDFVGEPCPFCGHYSELVIHEDGREEHFPCHCED